MQRLNLLLNSSINHQKNSLNLPRLHYLLELLKTLILRDIKIMYKGSVFGFGWSLISPLLLLIIFYFLFRKALSLNIPHYSLFTFCGLLSWTWFQASMYHGTTVVIASRELLRQPGFPVFILPIVAVGTNFVNFIISIQVLIIILILGNTGLNVTLASLPLVMAIQFLLTLGLTYFLAATNVIFRDTQHALTIILQLYFFMTPVFYDITMVPTSYRTLYLLNPMAQLLSAYRTILMKGEYPDWLPLLMVGAFSIILIGFGYRFFREVSYSFVEEI